MFCFPIITNSFLQHQAISGYHSCAPSSSIHLFGALLFTQLSHEVLISFKSFFVTPSHPSKGLRAFHLNPAQLIKRTIFGTISSSMWKIWFNHLNHSAQLSTRKLLDWVLSKWFVLYLWLDELKPRLFPMVAIFLETAQWFDIILHDVPP